MNKFVIIYHYDSKSLTHIEISYTQFRPSVSGNYSTNMRVKNSTQFMYS